MIQLIEKTPSVSNDWLAEMWAGYRSELLGAGMTPEDADRNIERNRKELFSGDEPVEGQYFFDVLNDGTIVGSLWLADKKNSQAKDWYIYDIVVNEDFRGQGLGRLTMQAAEGFVKSHGGLRMGLNVFGPNTVARALYESMSYQVMAVSMFKDFS
jgi:ribosomal protein S18 acetylase RimI-like enzyme